MNGGGVMTRVARNPWLLVLTGIPLLAVAWALAHWALPRGQNYYGMFAAAVVAGVVGNVLLVTALFCGGKEIRLLGVVFLLANWPVAADWLKVEPWKPRTVKYTVPPPRISTIIAKPRVELRGGSKVLVLADGPRKFEIFEAPAEVETLDPEKSFEFVIEQVTSLYQGFRSEDLIMFGGHRDPARRPDFDYLLPEIVTIDQDGVRIFDRSICEVHHQKMERKEIPFRRGWPCEAFPKSKAEQQLIPHYQLFISDGCSIYPTQPRSKIGFLCGGCEEAFRKWQAEHPRKAK